MSDENKGKIANATANRYNEKAYIDNSHAAAIQSQQAPIRYHVLCNFISSCEGFFYISLD